MSRFGATISASMIAVISLVGGIILLLVPASAASDADNAALRQATVTCQAQIKEQAQFHEMSMYARHKAVKKCVKEALAKH